MVLALLLACSSPVGPDWIRVEPPPSFRVLHAQVEACTGFTEPFERFQWYVAGDVLIIHGRAVGGYWHPPNLIVLDRYAWEAPEIVTHELIHAVTQGAWSHAAGWTAYVPSAAAWEGCGGR